MNKLRFFFPKEERLKSRKAISQLFREKKHSYLVHPIKISWMPTTLPDGVPAQALVVVPKRKFSKAVDRNRIKRLLREVYRKNRHLLFEALNSKEDKQWLIMLNYIGEKELSYHELEQNFLRIVDRFKAD